MSRIEAPLNTPLSEIFAGIKAQRFLPDAGKAYVSKGFRKYTIHRDKTFFKWIKDRHKLQTIESVPLGRGGQPLSAKMEPYTGKKVEVIATKILPENQVEFYIRLFYDPEAAANATKKIVPEDISEE